MRRKPVISLRGPVPQPPSSPLPLPPAELPDEQPKQQLQQQLQSRSINLLPPSSSYSSKAALTSSAAVCQSGLLLLRHRGDTELNDIDADEDDEDDFAEVSGDFAAASSGGGCSLAPLDLSIKDGSAKRFPSPQPEPRSPQQAEPSPLRPSPPASGGAAAAGSATRLSCTACDREFFDRSTLNRHIRTVHSGCKPHRCEFCGKGFARADYLRKHYTTHAGQPATAPPPPPPPPLHSPASQQQQQQQQQQYHPQQQQPPPPPPPLSPEVANALKAIWLQHKLLTTAAPSAQQF